jgi:hypothetical protein
MEIKMNIKNYDPTKGIQLNWEYGFSIQCQKDIDNDNIFVIKANKAGLLSLANHFLTLSQNIIPSGNHIHLDDSNGLEDNSCEFIIEKVEK